MIFLRELNGLREKPELRLCLQPAHGLEILPCKELFPERPSKPLLKNNKKTRVAVALELCAMLSHNLRVELVPSKWRLFRIGVAREGCLEFLQIFGKLPGIEIGQRLDVIEESLQSGAGCGRNGRVAKAGHQPVERQHQPFRAASEDGSGDSLIPERFARFCQQGETFAG